MIDHLEQAFTARFGGGSPPCAATAPGRVTLLGEHTDYHEGYVLPMAVDCLTTVVGRGRLDGRFRLGSLNVPEDYEGPLPLDGHGVQPVWARYVLGVAAGLREAGVRVQGCDALIHTAVPIGSGLSSSAALEVAFARFLLKVSRATMDPLQIARLCQAAEHQWAGVSCGLMDQMASSVGRPHHVLWLDCRTLEMELIALTPSVVSVFVCDGGESRDLASSGYQLRRAEGRELIHLLKRSDPTLASLRDVSPALWRASVPALPELLRKRGQHVLDENQRVLEAVPRLRAGQFREVGELMWASHASLAALYEVSTPRLNHMVDAVRAYPGVLGAKLTGAGFGGSVVVLVETPRAQRFLDEVDRFLPNITVRRVS